ncbi:hypothetical protein [Nonomuraea sp. NPDC046570]|uniref:hypothetical protein n=1 Tax=Nonomuraea sp. NPDC046570 TaxID=3155255 RepID=UPI0033E7769B
MPVTGQRAGVVVDPRIPEDDAELLRENRKVLAKIRAGWVPEPRRRVSSAPVKRAVLRMSVFFVVTALLLGAFRLSGGLLGFLFFAIIILIVLSTASKTGNLDTDDDTSARGEHEREVYEVARWHEGRYLLMEELDESARRLLERAQTAIDAVTDSVVNAEGLLDDVRNAVMLPQQEWEIARLLAKLSALRTQHRQTVSRGLTPEVAAVAEPLARALDSSEAAVVARVEALERYAGHVADAERAYHAHTQIEELRGRLHQYEELVAESGADRFAVPEIARLAGDAGELERALRRSVSSAHEAFRHLDG